jgi:FkbM family methyltransferase|tara:strand:+ start:312 stop:1034 length:723 start_codon:yes stop_codon:yes gene_type:complete
MKKMIKFIKKKIKLIVSTIHNVLKIINSNIFHFKDRHSFLNNVSGVIHVGANSGQERYEYINYSLNVVWVEPIPEVFKKLEHNIKKYPKQRAYKYLLTDIENQDVNFKITNNEGESSSIFNLGLHKNMYPGIRCINSINLKSSTLVNLIDYEKIDIQKYQALIIDTQGSELLVLKGGSSLLENFQYIKTEVADFEAYQGGCLLVDLSNYLKRFGFKEIQKTKFLEKVGIGSYFEILYERK